MTSQTNKLLKNKSKTIYICAYRELKLPIIAFILTIIILYFSDDAKSGAYNGLMLCINCVIPSLFPFMVLSDLALWVIDVDVGTVGRMFEGLLGIRKRGTTAYISGAICGYPVGISNTVSLRKNSLISKEEADILAPLSANPSLTFVTVGIGGGIFKSIVIGIFLYITSILSGIIKALSLYPPILVIVQVFPSLFTV